MELVGYTEEEERQITEISGIKDPEALMLAKEDFETRTGKEFPDMGDWGPNAHNLCAAASVSKSDVDRWANAGYPGGYKPGGRPF